MLVSTLFLTLTAALIYRLLEGDGRLAGVPVGRQWRLDIRNNHLEYAITWFSLAAALLVIYVLYHRRRT